MIISSKYLYDVSGLITWLINICIFKTRRYQSQMMVIMSTCGGNHERESVFSLIAHRS